MIIAIDSSDGIIKIGSPPEVLPGIIEFIKIHASLLLENTEIQGRSGKVKIVQGWDDADLAISLSFIDDPGAGKTRWDCLKQVAGVFKKVGANGKPEVYTLSHPMINAWGIKGFLFASFETTENRARRKITASLEFVEYESSAGVVQERQEASAQAGQAAVALEPYSIVSDGQRRGLGSMEERYANL